MRLLRSCEVIAFFLAFASLAATALAFVAEAPAKLAFAPRDRARGTNEFKNCFSSTQPSIRQSQYEYKSVHIDSLKKDIHLRAYVFEPDPKGSPSRRPAIIMFHGGRWKDGYPVTWFPTALFFASRGFVTISAQYRLESVHGSTPLESMADAREAFRWLQTNAKKFAIDKNQIVAAGDSAGAQLALALALINPDLKTLAPPRALLALYPVIDAKLRGFEGISPIDFLTSKNLPPTWIMQGKSDSQLGTPPAKTKEFCDKANRLAGQAVCEAKFFAGPPDFFHGFIGARAQYLIMLHEMEKFLIDQRLDLATRAFDAKTDALTPECEASADDPIFQRWVKEYGYSSTTSSLW